MQGSSWQQLAARAVQTRRTRSRPLAGACQALRPWAKPLQTGTAPCSTGTTAIQYGPYYCYGRLLPQHGTHCCAPLAATSMFPLQGPAGLLLQSCQASSGQCGAVALAAAVPTEQP